MNQQIPACDSGYKTIEKQHQGKNTMSCASNAGNLANASKATCPYCKGVSPHLLSSTDVNRKTTTEIFHFYQCPGCELIFLDPRPDDIGPFYKGGYQKIPKNLSQLRAIAKKEEYRMDPILRYKQRGRLLEIGPWMGIFSCNAKDAGFDVSAIEMNQPCVDFL